MTQTRTEATRIEQLKTIEVTWSEDSGEGRLIARCNEDHTLSSAVVEWPEPITAASDSHAIANAVTEINGAEIVAVEHDKDVVLVTVNGNRTE